MKKSPPPTIPNQGPASSTLNWTLLFIALVAVVLAGTSLLGGTYSGDVLQVYFYQSFWYRGLVVALCALIVVCLVRPRRLSAGFVLTHAAFVLLCLAAILGSRSELRASLTLRQGETANQLMNQLMTQEVRVEPLPFLVRLNHFQIEHYPPRFHLLQLSGKEILHSLPVRTGETLVSGVCRVTILGEATVAAAPVAPDAPRLLFVYPRDGTASVAVGLPDRLQATYPVTLDTPFTVDALSAEVTVLQSFHDFVIGGGEPKDRSDRPDNPAVKVRIRNLADGVTKETWLFARFPDFGTAGGAHGDSETGPLLRVRIDNGSGAPTTEETLRQGDPIALPPEAGQGTTLVWDAAPEIVKDFYSDLSVLRDGREWARQTVEVNHPLVFEGYRFYQTSYDKQELSYSEFKVVRDPWLPLFYIGACLMVLGTAILCFDPRKGRG